MIVSVEEFHLVGEDAFFDSVAENTPNGVVFQDNSETGYFYALDLKEGQKIIDAVHVYDAASMDDKEINSKIQIAWTQDGMIASLLINDYCHAIFDFQNKSGYCRNGF